MFLQSVNLSLHLSVSTLNYPAHSLMHCSISLLLLSITLLGRYPVSRLYTSRRRRNRHRPVSSILYFLTVHTRCRTRIVDASAYLIAALDVHVFDVEGVDVAGEITQKREEEVDEEVGTASRYEEDTERWDCAC
jgi:hypothetical protein